MDSERFDDLIRRLGTTRLTRTRALRGLVGSALVALTGAGLSHTSTDAKAKKRKGPSRIEPRKASQATAGKVTICHFTHSQTNPYNLITVSQNSVQEQSHLAHGDTYYGDCCLDADCARLDDQCNVGRCVVNDRNVGSCKPVFKAGRCDDGKFCTVNDACVENRDGSGSCTGAPRDCSAVADQCNTGDCDEAADRCKPVFKSGPCDDGKFCTVNDACVKNDDGTGSCTGDPRVCPSDQCNSGDCDEAADKCTLKPTPGEPCNDHDQCTVDDTCNADGICVGRPKCNADDCEVCDDDGDCTSTCGEGTACDGSGHCVTTCPHDRPLFCPGHNGHSGKCCPTDSICDYSPSGAVNCRNL